MSGPVSSLISRLETLLETRSSLLETRNSKLETQSLRLETRNTRLKNFSSKIFEFRVSSRVVRVSSDCQLTFDRYCMFSHDVFMLTGTVLCQRIYSVYCCSKAPQKI